MAIALVTLSAGSNTLVEAQPGKIIRVRRIVGAPSSDLTLQSGSTPILPELKIGSSNFIDIEFQDGNVQTARGEALNAGAFTGPFTIWVLYEIVD